MTTGYVVNLNNGHNGYCVEIIPGVTYCGDMFSPGAHAREVYAIDRDDEHPHNYFCYDCSKADSRQVRCVARGELA